jgi:hypothetical protein
VDEPGKRLAAFIDGFRHILDALGSGGIGPAEPDAQFFAIGRGLKIICGFLIADVGCDH